MNNNTPHSIQLDGSTITADDIAAIAHHGTLVTISDVARKKAESCFEILLAAAQNGHKIYGFTVGVGWNKDKTYIDAKGTLSDELINASIDFNKGLIRAHAGSVGEILPINSVRAILAVRLNMLLTGSAGIQPAYLDVYAEMLNKNIIPVVPSKGSIGQADVAVLGHIALCFIGEGSVHYNGQIMPSKQAFALADIPIIEPYGKDALAMVSTNAVSLGLASLAIVKLKQLVAMQQLIFSLSLEALNGNVSPLLADNVKQKGFSTGKQIAKTIRTYLSGSYLWQNSDSRELQDPLSFRDAHWTISTLQEALERAEQKLHIQLNHGDDNPTVSLGGSAITQQYGDCNEVQKRYVSDKGALFVSGNADPITWLLDFEYMTIALAHNANAACQRIIKLNTPQFTNLPRFLGSDNTYHAFGAMEKVFVSLAREIQLLANPASVTTTTIAGMIEDVASNAPLAITRLHTAIDNYAYILGMELIHSAQAIDWRLRENKSLTLGKDTKILYDAFREHVHFLDSDKSLSGDFECSARFVQQFTLPTKTCTK
ncbi:MAG: aromatic amino acid lyase [Gammaproteobacteria bacterium]|nr:aromatic amino acid lyase [Gammaproteobacteria bacterium]